MNLKPFAFILICPALLLTIAGCGVTNTPPTSTPTTPTAANLSGNWLLAGSLPSNDLVLSPIPGQPGAAGVAAVFDVVGSQVSGTLTAAINCNAQTFFTTITIPTVVTGTVAADGSFVLSTPTPSSPIVPSTTFTVQGKLPATPGGSWTGTFSYSMNPSLSLCTTNTTGSGAISATSIPLLNGAYTGTTVASIFSSTPPVTVTTTLKQSGTITVNGVTGTSNALLSGNITIAGSSCLTSGIPSNIGPTAVSGGLTGNVFHTEFLMNDSSILGFEGSIQATDASKITGALSTLQPGTCNANFNAAVFTLTKK